MSLRLLEAPFLAERGRAYQGAPILCEAAVTRLGAVDTRTIAILEGDETGQELLEEAVRVLAPDAIGLDLELPRFDLSLEARRRTNNQVVHDAAAAVRKTAWA